MGPPPAPSVLRDVVVSLDEHDRPLRVDGPYDDFGAHPIVGDGYGYGARRLDISGGPRKREMRCFPPSGDHRGAAAPLTAEPGALRLDRAVA
jgi:hypothetical protein